VPATSSGRPSARAGQRRRPRIAELEGAEDRRAERAAGVAGRGLDEDPLEPGLAAPALDMLGCMKPLPWWTLLVMIGCAATPRPVPAPPAGAPPSSCDARQTAISREADARAAPWSVARHLAKNFPDGRVSWLMTDAAYQRFVVKPAARKWGRCNDTGCYVFVAPAAVIHDAVAHAMTDGHHDPAALGQAFGLPAASFEGPLRMMTLDIAREATCIRLPVDDDPGVWKCPTPQDTDCFQFGGYTSGGIPELMAIDAPVDRTAIEEVP
jgi:hypothetical protein